MSIDEIAPSVELLHALVTVDRTQLDLDGELAVVAGWERLLSWATACQHEMLLQAEQSAGDLLCPDTSRWLCERVGLALGVTGGSAQRRLHTAATLAEKLPSVAAALKAGEVTSHHARLLACDALSLPVQVALDAEKVAMCGGDWRTPSQLQAAFREAVINVDPDGAAERHEAKQRERRVSCRNEPDGMASLWALLPAESCKAVAQKVEAHARSTAAQNLPGNCRTLEQRRADALVDLILRDSSTSTEPTLHGRRPEICVTVAWSTLIGTDDAPADLTGYGPIDADTARRIAADPHSVWRRLLVDPVSGRLLDYGRTTYRPPQDLQNHVIARDRTCRFPTCDPVTFAANSGRQRDRRPRRVETTRVKPERRYSGWTHDRDPDSRDSIWTDLSGNEHVKAATALPTPAPVEPPDDHGPPPF